MWQQQELDSELEYDLWGTVNWGKKLLFDFNPGKTRTENVWVCSWRKSFFIWVNMSLSSEIDCGAYIVSLVATVAKKIKVLDMLDKLEKGAVGPSPAASFEPLLNCQKVASLNLFCRYYFGRFLSELVQLVPHLCSWGKSMHLFCQYSCML